MSEQGINVIVKAKVSIQGFDIDRFETVDTWVTELAESGIVTYTIPPKSRKHTDIIKRAVDKSIMRDFFAEVYSFIRTADSMKTRVDDSAHRIEIYYMGGHKEIFTCDVLRADESLEGMLLHAAENGLR